MTELRPTHETLRHVAVAAGAGIGMRVEDGKLVIILPATFRPAILDFLWQQQAEVQRFLVQRANAGDGVPAEYLFGLQELVADRPSNASALAHWELTRDTAERTLALPSSTSSRRRRHGCAATT
jgi:hypothetical protein